MYVARRGSHFYVARMPGSGSLHAPDCASVEDVNYLTGFTAYAPEAVAELDDGCLAVNFSPSASGDDPVSSVSLSGLFDLLIEQANLNRYIHCGEPAKVTWSAVRTRILSAATNLMIGTSALSEQLAVPRPFDKEAGDSETADFEASLRTATPHLLCAPFKEIRKSPYGWQLVLKHLPRLRFWLSDEVAAAAEQASYGHFCLDAPPRFALCLAVVRANKTPGSFTVSHLSVKPTDASFMPCANDRFAEISDQLLKAGESFVRVLRFDAPTATPLADYALLDASMTPVFIDTPTGNLDVDATRRSLANLFEKNGCPARFFGKTPK